MDTLDQLSDEALRMLQADVQVQLEKGTGTRPILFMLSDARRRAVKAVGMMVEVDPNDFVTIIRLQAEIKIFIDMIESARAVIDRGKEADRRIKEDDRAAIDELVMGMTDEERRLYKFEPRGTD